MTVKDITDLLARYSGDMEIVIMDGAGNLVPIAGVVNEYTRVAIVAVKGSTDATAERSAGQAG